MRAVFFGTPEPSALALEALLSSRHEVVGVVTQPDRPKGRSGAAQPPPVKSVAVAHGLAVLQPETPKEEGFAQRLRDLGPEVLAVVAYGHLLPVAVLEVARAVNAHFSLLPRYRGAAPVQRAILAGERQTGVSTFLLEPTMDTGPILMTERLDIRDEETAGELLGRLAPVGARLLVASLDGLEDGTLEPASQDPSLATPAPKVKPEEAEIDWTRPAEAIVNAVRAFNPSPGAWTTWRGQRLKVWRARALAGGPPDEPGRAVSSVEVSAGDGALRLVEVQLEGGRRLAAEEFARGHRVSVGDRFGTERDR